MHFIIKCNLLPFFIIMEDYLFTDAVIQASHMLKYQSAVKHLKKYDLNSNSATSSVKKKYSQCALSINNKPNMFSDSLRSWRGYNTMNLSAEIHKINLAQKQDEVILITGLPKHQKNPSKDQVSQHSSGSKSKRQTKMILSDDEKIILINQNNQKINEPLKQFFFKRQIDAKSKTQKDYTRPLSIQRKKRNHCFRMFYDVDINLIKHRSRKCVILPEKNSLTTRESNRGEQKENSIINIRDLISKEWKQQCLKRKTQCKTAASHTRHKAIITKQTKKIQQQLKSKELQENSLGQKSSQTYRHCTGLPIDSKTIVPLSKQQMKSQSIAIMQKYSVDVNKCYIKHVK